MQQVSLPFALTSALLGLTALHCGPAVARQPPPTPVYASELTVPPAEVTQESLREPAATRAPESAPTESPAPETGAGSDAAATKAEAEAEEGPEHTNEEHAEPRVRGADEGPARSDVETPAPPPPDRAPKTR